MSTHRSTSGGLSLLGTVFVVLLALKLLGVAPVASWSWLWVTSPIWGGWLLILGAAIIVGLGFAIASFMDWTGLG